MIIDFPNLLISGLCLRGLGDHLSCDWFPSWWISVWGIRSLRGFLHMLNNTDRTPWSQRTEITECQNAPDWKTFALRMGFRVAEAFPYHKSLSK